jgi:predicted transcriptional regulator YheO
VDRAALARIADPEFAQIFANHRNQFADGRQAQSTSIGIKDSSGKSPRSV